MPRKPALVLNIKLIYIENILTNKIPKEVFFSKKYYDLIRETLIYSTVRNKLQFKSKKSNNILSLRDSYILKNKNSKIYEDYLKQLIWANQNFSNIQMKNGSYNENDIWSRKYFIN